MNIQWLGHSCFRLSSGGYAIVLDPYRDDKVPGLRPLTVTANAVLCSHQHDDHGYAAAVTLIEEDKRSPFSIISIESTHDDEGGSKRGMNTIHVLEAEGLRVAHLGDLGTTLTSGQIAAIGPLDALMIPVGGHYTIDAPTAKAVVDSMSVRVVIPMHYRSDTFGFDVIGTLEPFLNLFDSIDYLHSNMLELGPDETPRVVVMEYV